MKNIQQFSVLIFIALYYSLGFAAPAYDDQAPMVRLGNLLLDPAMTTEEQASAQKNLDEARANIAGAYGEQKAEMPDILWCKIKECAVYFSGNDGRSFSTSGNGYKKTGSHYTFWKPTIVFTRPIRARSPADIRAVETLTHELSHTEFRARLRNASIPAWFNEGIATYIGKEHDCKAGMRGIDKLTDLVTSDQWQAYTNRSNQTLVNTYCQAREEVAAWIELHGGFGAIVDLLDKRAHFSGFDSLYGPLVVQQPAPDSLKEKL